MTNIICNFNLESKQILEIKNKSLFDKLKEEQKQNEIKNNYLLALKTAEQGGIFSAIEFRFKYPTAQHYFDIKNLNKEKYFNKNKEINNPEDVNPKIMEMARIGIEELNENQFSL